MRCSSSIAMKRSIFKTTPLPPPPTHKKIQVLLYSAIVLASSYFSMTYIHNKTQNSMYFCMKYVICAQFYYEIKDHFTCSLFYRLFKCCKIGYIQSCNYRLSVVILQWDSMPKWNRMSQNAGVFFVFRTVSHILRQFRTFFK